MRDPYVSALAASIDGDFKFIQSNGNDIGVLEISMDAKFLINDGQHKKGYNSSNREARIWVTKLFQWFLRR